MVGRKFSRRDFLRLSAVTAVGAALAACAPKAAPETAQPGEVSTEAKPPEAETVTLIFWNGFNAHEVDALNQMIDKHWAPTHANIKIDPTGEQSPEAILTAISGGNPPDVAILWDAAPVTLWAHQGAIKDLTPSVEASDLNLEALIVPAALEWVRYRGKYYGLPFVDFNWGFYWNKTLFEDVGLDPDKPPETIEELETYAHKLTKLNDAGEIMQLGWMPVNSSWAVDLIFSFGGRFYDPDSGAVTANDPHNVQALDWDVGLAKEFGLDKITAFTSGFSEGDNPFFLGKVAMTIDGCWQVAFIKEYAPDLEYGVAPVPAKEPAYAKSNGVGTNPIVIPNGGKHFDESWEFAQFLGTNVEVARQFADLVSNIPQVQAAVNNFSDDPNTQFFAELSQSPNARAWYPLPVASFYDDELNNALGQIYSGQASPKEALDVVQKNVQAELEKLE